MTREVSASLITHAPQHDACVNAAETKRIAHDVLQISGASVIRYRVEIAGGIGISVIYRGRDPLPIDCERTKCGLYCTSRAQRMRVIPLGSGYRNAPRMIAEHLFNGR